MERVTHDILILVSACVIAALAGLLSGIRFPTGKKWRNLGVARAYLALSCITLSVLSVLNFFIKGYLIQDPAKNWSVEDILVLFIASGQALLFTMTLLTFIQPLYVRKERIIPQVAAIVAGGGLLLLAFFLWIPLFPVILYAAMAAYLFQLVAYTASFQRNYALCLKQLGEYYDEDEDQRLQWVRTSFYTSLSIGMMVLCSLFFKGWVYDAFIVIYTIFYLYMVIRFLNYKNKEIKFVLPAVTGEARVGVKEYPKRQKPKNNKQMTERELSFKLSLEDWIKEKRFSEKDVGVEEIAQSLGADAAFLRYYFRTYIKDDFRTWRSGLRIHEARRMLEENPQLPLSKVCKAVGFNDKGNFHRQFQKITGTTPADYKQGCRESSTTNAPRLPYQGAIGHG